MTRPISILYADPPWPWATYSRKAGEKTGAGCRRMDWKALMELGYLIQPHLDPRAYLLLWMPKGQIKSAIYMAEQWGFTRVVSGPLFTWVKQNPSGKHPLGTGYLTRGNPEGCWLFGRRPDQSLPARRIARIEQGLEYWGPPRTRPVPVPRELQLHPPGALWSKPPAIRRLIEQMWPGDLRRLELFSRPHPDLDQSVWECYGDEMNGQDILPALAAGLPLGGMRDDG